MEYIDGLIGKVVNHKLLGRCIITKAPAPSKLIKNPNWTIRLPDARVLVINPEELEELNYKAENLKKWALGAKNLAVLAEKEAAEMEKENV